MRVLHVDTGRRWRGGQQQAYFLHRRLTALGIDSVMIAPNGSPLYARCHREGLPAVSTGFIFRSLGAFVGILLLAGEETIVHAHDARALALASAAKAVKSGLKVVAHRRVSYPLSAKPLSAWKNNRADAWIAVSGEIGGQLKKYLKEGSKVSVIHSSIDLESYVEQAVSSSPEELRAEFGIPAGAPVVGMMGAFSPQKGHETLIEAAKEVLDEVPEAVFLLAGEGETRGRIIAEAGKVDGGRAFKFPGFRADSAAVTNLFTVAAVPSVDGEGSSASIKEPMALGVPVVVSDLAGNLEVAGDAAKSFKVGDAKGLARELTALLRDGEERARLGERGRERVQIFSVESMAEKTLALYREVLGA